MTNNYLTPEQAALIAAKMHGDGPRTRRCRLSQSKRRTVYARDGHACVACGSTDDLTLDHVVPRSHGGADRNDNLQTMCRSCNAMKADHE